METLAAVLLNKKEIKIKKIKIPELSYGQVLVKIKYQSL